MELLWVLEGEWDWCDLPGGAPCNGKITGFKHRIARSRRQNGIREGERAWGLYPAYVDVVPLQPLGVVQGSHNDLIPPPLDDAQCPSASATASHSKKVASLIQLLPFPPSVGLGSGKSTEASAAATVGVAGELIINPTLLELLLPLPPLPPGVAVAVFFPWLLFITRDLMLSVCVLRAPLDMFPQPHLQGAHEGEGVQASAGEDADAACPLDAGEDATTAIPLPAGGDAATACILDAVSGVDDEGGVDCTASDLRLP